MGRSVVVVFRDLVNEGWESDKVAFIDGVTEFHPCLQQEAFNLFLGCIQRWAEHEVRGTGDGRDAKACRLSLRIVEALKGGANGEGGR